MTWLITIRPGPVLHIWRDGAEVAAVPLTRDMLATLIRDLVNAMWHKDADPVPHSVRSPMEHERW
jgi:hypothetical protein